MVAHGQHASVTEPLPQPSTSGSLSSSAKRCVETFFDHLEATIRKKLKSRTNGVQSVDWTKMAVLWSAAPKDKPRTPILSSSRTWRTDLAVDIKPEVKQQLREIFIRYCAWGDKRSFMFMSRAQFIRFARDMCLCNDTIDAFGLSTLFEKILAGSIDPGAAARLGMLDYILAITALASKLYQGHGVQDALDKMVEKYVLPRASAPLAEPEGHDTTVLQSDVLTVLERLRPKLLLLWDHYMEFQAKQERKQPSSAGGSGGVSPRAPSLAATATSGGGGGAAASMFSSVHSFTSEPAAAGTYSRAQSVILPTLGEALAAQSAGMSLATFQKFCSEFEVTGTLLSKLQLTGTFKKCKFGLSESGEPYNAAPNIRLAFPEFSDCVARCALIAYKYSPPQVPPPALDFKSSYQTAAKEMWLREAAAGNMGGDDTEDELIMPAAIAGPGLGNEDRAHYDDVLSRAPSMRIAGPNGLMSRAVSIVQGRTRTSGPGGLEMMLIHPEPSQMAQDPNKPLHLQQFTCDWVGRPGLPLSETGRLRRGGTDPWVAAGIYHTGAHTDPKFEQRMRDMVEARVVREQALAALQLQYQAERREETRAAARRNAAKRAELELVSGQTVARLGPLINAQAMLATATSGQLVHATGGRSHHDSSGNEASLQQGEGLPPAVQHAARSGSAPARGSGKQSGKAGAATLTGRAQHAAATTGKNTATRAFIESMTPGGNSIVLGLEEVLARTMDAAGRASAVGMPLGASGGGTFQNGAGAAPCSKTLIQELHEALDVQSKLPHVSYIAGHGQIRFG